MHASSPPPVAVSTAPVTGRRRRLVGATAVAVAATLALAGCTDDTADASVEELRSELAARSAAEGELLDRLDQLETEVDRLRTDRGADRRLESLQERVDGLAEGVSGVQDRVDGEATARAEATEAAETEAADLRRQLVELTGEVEAVQAEAEELRTLYETLRDRLDRQQRG